MRTKPRQHQRTEDSANLRKASVGMTEIERSNTQNQNRESKQTRNKAGEENQIQEMTQSFKDAGTITSMPNHTCSADQ
jgi:hypothetical protein